MAAYSSSTEPTPSPTDPMAALYAMNLGDFVADSFISEELAERISSRALSEPDKIKSQLQELVELYSLDKTLNILGFQAQEERLVYDGMSQSLNVMFQTQGCHLFEFSSSETGQRFMALLGSTHRAEETLHYPETSSAFQFYWQAFRQPGASVLENLGESWPKDNRLGQGAVEQLMLCPLWRAGNPVGLMVFQRQEGHPFTEAMASLAERVSNLLVMAQQLQQLLKTVQEALKADVEPPYIATSQLLNWRAELTEGIAELSIQQHEFLSALAGLMDDRQNLPAGYSQAVAEVAQALAEGLQLNEKTGDLVYYAALYGKLGLAAVSDKTLTKKPPLGHEEWERIRQHPNTGVSLMMHLHALGEVVPYVRYQNERWDGSGQPEGLKGRNIPLGSRILGVAQAFCALRQQRPYREAALNAEEALSTLHAEAGSKWDPLVVETLAKVLKQGLLV